MLDGVSDRLTFKLEMLEPRRLLSAALDDLAVAEVDSSEALVWEWKQPSIHWVRNEAIAASPDGVYRDELGRFEANLAPGEYSVMIDWGDGTTSAGWIAHHLREPFSGQPYGVHVRGDHVYAEAGKYNVVATVTASDGLQTTFHQDFIPFASPIQLVNQHAFSYSGERRVYYHALFFPGNIDIDRLSGTIDWGDGTSTPASAGEMIWSGAIPLGADHVYAEFGTYTITLTATAPGGASGALETMVVNKTITVQPPLPQDSSQGVRDDMWFGAFPVIAFTDGITEDAPERVPDQYNSSAHTTADPPASANPDDVAVDDETANDLLTPSSGLDLLS